MFKRIKEIKEQIRLYYQHEATLTIYGEFITICIEKNQTALLEDLKILMNIATIELELYRKLFPTLTLDKETLTELENEVWDVLKNQFFNLYLMS